jgi:excisionase family DNA binding protein
MKPASRVLREQSERSSRRERLMSPVGVARFLGVPLRTLYRWRSRGDGPRGYRLGRHVRYRVDDVERWLEDHRDVS